MQPLRPASRLGSTLLFACSVACSGPVAEEASTESELVARCKPGMREVGGLHVGDTVFEECTLKADERVLVRGSLKLLAGATLTLTPLARPVVDGTWSSVLGELYPPGREIVVEGSFSAEGTASAPITIAAAGGAKWLGIDVAGTSSRVAYLRTVGIEVGLTLMGTDRPIRHVTATGARRGLVVQSNADVVVEDYEGGAIALASHRGRVQLERARVDVTGAPGAGGVLLNGASGVVDDAVVLGAHGDRWSLRPSTSGIHTGADQTLVRRSFVSGFEAGVTQQVEGTELAIEDTTLVGNGSGVSTHSPTLNAPVDCPPPLPAPPKDPRITRSQISKNLIGVFHEMRGVLTVEDSVITGNAGPGIYVMARVLHPESKVVRSNVYENGRTGWDAARGASTRPEQIYSKHRGGGLTLRDNFWGAVPLDCRAREAEQPQRTFSFVGFDDDLPRCSLGYRPPFTCEGYATAPIASAGVRVADLSPSVIAARAAAGF